jgi:hypothetical protein
MDTDKPMSTTDNFFRQHPRLLLAINIVLLILITIDLLVTTEAPVVLYQAF